MAETLREIYGWQINMKRCSMSYIIREMKIKMRYHYITIRMAKTWTQMLARMWNNRILIACGNANGTVIWKIVWQFLTKLTILFTIGFSNSAPCYSPKWAENLCPKIHTWYSSFVHPWEKLGTTKMCSCRWITVIHLDNGIFTAKQCITEPWKNTEEAVHFT